MPTTPSSTTIDYAVRDLRELAHAITRAVDTLPRNASRSTIELLELQARRALAIAAALQVEQPMPDSGIVAALLAAKKQLAVVVVGVLALVATGAGEQAGADAYNAVKEVVERMVQGETRTDSMPFPGEYLRQLRVGAGLTQRGLARAANTTPSRISRYETYAAQPPAEEISALVGALADRLGIDAPGLMAQLEVEAARAADSAIYLAVEERRAQGLD